MAKKQASKRRGKIVKNGEEAAAFEQGEAAAPKFFDAGEVAEELGAWWQSGKDAFLRRDVEGRWHQWNQQSLIDKMRALPGRLINIKAREGEPLSEAKQVLLWLRENRGIDGVMTALPGYASGIYSLDAGERILVKTSPTLIEPKRGEWPTIRKIIEGMLGGDGLGSVDQTPWFWSLCKCWYEAFAKGSPGNWKQGHALILTGPAGCGKNLVQELILTALIGGRYADPLKFLMNEDEFNGDMMVEHWLLGEIPSSQRTEDRVAFSERIKQLVANRTLRARLMRSEPSTIRPFLRLSISVNDDPDTLRSLPIVSSGYGDKILIFHCRAKPLPILSEGGDDDFEKEQRVRKVIAEEMPAFIEWLVNDYKIPAALVEDAGDGRNVRRFGFREFHHPVIKGELFDDTPAAQLLRLIDMAELRESHTDISYLRVWELNDSYNYQPLDSRNRWWERAETLQQLLTGEGGLVCSVATMAKKLFQHNKIERLLGRLASDDATGGVRVVKDKSTNTRLWKGWWVVAPTE